MKANEAPDRLYILFNHPYTVDYTKLNKRRNEEEVEYTRTDAFIEKACEWLKSNLYNYAGEDDKRNIVPFDESIFDDFRKYMEGQV